MSNTGDNFDIILQMSNTQTILTNFPDMKERFTSTLSKQLETETLIQSIYDDIMDKGSQSYPQLQRKSHIYYVHSFLNKPLPQGYSKMMTNIPWMTYWLSNAAITLQSGLMPLEIKGINERVMDCFQYEKGFENEVGGFAGGKDQLPHIASTYAAILSLANAYDKETLIKLDRKAIKRWMLNLKQMNGSFVMHAGGESDCRAVYCALVTGKLLNLLDDDLTSGCGEWLKSCQTYEGGFSGEPGGEAHGGYTYCALAALVIMYGINGLANGESGIDLDSLISWCVQRQHALEGGLSGRTNKLVDACYSHWVGNVLGLLETIVNAKLGNDVSEFVELWDRNRMMAYLICCCQDEDGGLRDKPEMFPDFYHTCYALSGLSACQYIHLINDQNVDDNGFDISSLKIEDNDVIDQNPVNFVNCIDPIFSLPVGVAERIRKVFEEL